MKKYFVVSDVHSFYNELMDALNKNGFNIDDENHHLVVCGDLFDRGPDAIKCFNFVKSLNSLGRLHYVRGNHEDLLCDLFHEMKYYVQIGMHHFQNGTVDTVAQLIGCNPYDILNGVYNRDELENKVGEVLDFFQENCVDYFEIGDHIFVHGWIPCNSDDTNKYHGKKVYTSVYTEWSDDFDTIDRDRMWERARWINGMDAWHQNMRLIGKTIVCGHWHCSWGWSHLMQDRKEFPAKNRVDWEKSFEPFIQPGIIALDACTAYTGFVNCVVIETE